MGRIDLENVRGYWYSNQLYCDECWEKNFSDKEPDSVLTQDEIDEGCVIL